MVAEYVGPGRWRMKVREWIRGAWTGLWIVALFVTIAWTIVALERGTTPQLDCSVSRRDVQLDSLIAANQRIAAELARIADALQKAEAP